MEKLESKKIYIATILICITGIIIGYISKEPFYRGEYHTDKKWIPLNYYYIDFFGYNLSYKNLLIFLLIILAIAIYGFLFKKDEEIKNSLIFIKNGFLESKILTVFMKSIAEIKKTYNEDPNKIYILNILKKIVKYIKDFYALGDSNKMGRIVKRETQDIRRSKKSFFKNLISYNGRIGRTEFLVKVGLINLISSSIIKTYTTSDSYYEDGSIIILGLSIILFQILETFQVIKRLHDFNLSGWFCLIYVLPKHLLVYQIIFKNYISLDYTYYTLILFTWSCPLLLLLFILMPGSKSKNKYGYK